MTFKIEVPAEAKKAPVSKVPPAGRHIGTLQDLVRVRNEKFFDFDWSFEAENRIWMMGERLDLEDAADRLADLGFAGKAVGPEDVIGAVAMLHVVTSGGRSSARIKEVRGLTPEERSTLANAEEPAADAD